MKTIEPYNRQTLNRRAAEFYNSIRKEEKNWKSIVDLSPMVAEFNHYIAAGDFENAFKVYDSIHGHLANWSEFQRIIEMGETLLSEKDPFLKLSEVIIMKVKTYVSWTCVMTAQFEKGEELALEAKTTSEKLFEKGPADTDYKSADEFKTRIFTSLMCVYVFTGQMEKALEHTKEYEEKYKDEENVLCKASFNFFRGWMYQEMGDDKSTEGLLRGSKHFNELDETKMDVYHLNEKQRNLYCLSGDFAKKGQTEASLEVYEESRKINKQLNLSFFEMVMPFYAGLGIRYSYELRKARGLAVEGIIKSEKHEFKWGLAKNTLLSGSMMRDKGIWNIFMNKSESKEGEERPYQHQKKAYTFFQAAIDILQRGAQVANELGLAVDESTAYGRIGNIYCHLGHSDQGLFLLAEKNLEKSLDLWPTKDGKYNTNLDLGRLNIFWAAKIYNDRDKDKKQRKKDAIKKVNQANEHFNTVYENAKKKEEPAYVAKAAFGLGVVALETALVKELKGDEKKNIFDEATEKFDEAKRLLNLCVDEIEKDQFLRGQAEKDFIKDYKQQPINLRLLREMECGHANAKVGSSISANGEISDSVVTIYKELIKDDTDTIDHIRNLFRNLNMLRVSLEDPDKNEAKKVIDICRTEVIKEWRKKNGFDEIAKLKSWLKEKDEKEKEKKIKWGYPLSDNVIVEFFRDELKEILEIVGETE